MATLEIVNGLARLLLGFVFMNAGGLKIGLDRADLVEEWGAWVADQPSHRLRMVGAVEVAAGGLLILPLVFAVSSHLVVAGAVAILAVLAGACAILARYGDRRRITAALVLAALAGLTLWTLPG